MMIGNLQEYQIDLLDIGFQEQGWPSRKAALITYLEEQKNGERIVLVAENNGICQGYITLERYPKSGPFAEQVIPEIVDFNVFEKYQKCGIGRKLLEAICQEASFISDLVGIGVGLNANYGNAQRLYVKVGFIPDGTGVWYRGKQLAVGASACNDDDLALYFTKKVKKNG